MEALCKTSPVMAFTTFPLTSNLSPECWACCCGKAGSATVISKGIRKRVQFILVCESNRESLSLAHRHSRSRAQRARDTRLTPRDCDIRSHRDGQTPGCHSVPAPDPELERIQHRSREG